MAVCPVARLVFLLALHRMMVAPRLFAVVRAELRESA
jgi:hypothetical protein